ncbi:uncharacterized protein PGTG_19407 [Puccinia graminis f. sp. tritici CRL 75-36-700-3]|uniref:Uncharacterized protein n=1 Tax=Puccinia graminis f. sp. tritici (strain CRL 75-36-700-3 / race SCCL) TaxID=418459 RepID=E3LA14_PUCGT|nr:uncharacterized protein PGTG_19407 [Puccinia graminis f. sp. tritici CRL 75-36-700-3]EFP93389.1 hypothetical protein PGTG_19407 [Puccinia graminis f. sp. tritici CRL 75-36-700-3]
MSPSTRSGRTYSETPSITSSRRSSTTRSVRGRKPRSTAQVDADPIGGGQDQPTAEGLNPSSIKEKRTSVETNLAGTSQINNQEKSRINDSQEDDEGKHRKAIGIIRPSKTTDEAHPNPTIIRKGQEETSYLGSDTDVNPIKTPSAVYRRPAENDPTTGAQPPSSANPQDQSIPIVGRNGQLNAVEDQACRIYRQQYHMYETAKKANQHADATRALTECQRSYRNISKKLTWQFALSVNNGWNPFKEAKSAKLLAKLEGRSQPTASGSRPSGSYTSSSNQRGKRPAETDLNKLGKIPKLDTSWRETMAAARALQQARAQVLEELHKEEEASKRRKKD